MKLILKITAAILLAGLIGWAVVDFTSFRHTFAGYNKEEIEQAQHEYDRTRAEVQRGLDRQILDLRAKRVDYHFGEAAGATYRLCHEHPPETKKHQQECKRLDDQLAVMDAADAKHPW